VRSRKLRRGVKTSDVHDVLLETYFPAIQQQVREAAQWLPPPEPLTPEERQRLKVRRERVDTVKAIAKYLGVEDILWEDY
jgi:hypothetical protein